MRLARIARLLVPLLVISVAAATAVFADEADAARLEALRQAVSQIGQPDAPAALPAQVCWSPHERFSPAGKVAEVLYAPRLLVARYDHVPVQQDTPCQAVWLHDGQPLSMGECLLQPGVGFVTNGIRRQESPLLPGVYCVVFRAGEQNLAAAEIRVMPPAPLGQRPVKDVYLAATLGVQRALQQVDQAQAQAAATEASQALPLLATVVMARPDDGDAAAMLELAHAIVAVGRMEATAAGQQTAAALDWAERAAAHARTAEGLAADAKFKATCKQMADTLQQALPKLSGAAAG